MAILGGPHFPRRASKRAFGILVDSGVWQVPPISFGNHPTRLRSAEKLTGPRIDFDSLALLKIFRDLNLQASLKGGRFRPAGG